MNKVRTPPVNPVVVTLMANADPVFGIVAKLRVFRRFLDVVRLKFSAGPTQPAGVPVSLQHRRLPRQILRAATTLILSLLFALGCAPARLRAVGVRVGFAAAIVYELRDGARKPLAAGIAGANGCVRFRPTRLAAIRAPLEVRSRTLYHLPAVLAGLTRPAFLGGATTRTGAKPTLAVLRPTLRRALGDYVSTASAFLQLFHITRYARG